MTKQRIYWLCQVLGWGTYGIAQVVLYSFLEGFDWRQAVGELFQVTYYFLATHLFRNLIIRFKWLQLRLIWLIPRVLAFTFVLSILNYGCNLAIPLIFSQEIAEKDLTPLGIVIITSGSWGLYFVWTIFYFVFHYIEQYNKSLKVEAEAREAELNNLKAQLNPHFIFNALNSIRALVDENPRKSKESITQLSHILRNSLASDRKRLISFSEELKTVMDYLALESIRYEERLSTSFDIDKQSGKFLIPPLMLQTLVENGIKHGISNIKSGGEISIRSRVQEKHLVLEIRNTGQLPEERRNSLGVGLMNTQKRLELLYGAEATFRIENENSKTVLTKITIPEQ